MVQSTIHVKARNFAKLSPKHDFQLIPHTPEATNAATAFIDPSQTYTSLVGSTAIASA